MLNSEKKESEKQLYSYTPCKTSVITATAAASAGSVYPIGGRKGGREDGGREGGRGCGGLKGGTRGGMDDAEESDAADSKWLSAFSFGKLPSMHSIAMVSCLQVLVVNPYFRRGVMLLGPENLTVLGGMVSGA
jgi:hypothetical protein